MKLFHRLRFGHWPMLVSSSVTLTPEEVEQMRRDLEADRKEYHKDSNGHVSPLMLLQWNQEQQYLDSAQWPIEFCALCADRDLEAELDADGANGGSQC